MGLATLKAERRNIESQLKTYAGKLDAFVAIEEPTADQVQEVEDIEAKVDGLKERMETIDKQLKGTRQTSPDPIRNRDQESGWTAHSAHVGDPVADSSYCGIHRLNPGELTNGGFKSLGEFFEVYNSQRYDPRIQGQMQVASGYITPFSGGVMVPEQFLVSDLHPPTEDEIVLPRATKYSMEGEILHISAVANLTNASGAIHGFTGQWVAEHGTFTDQEVTTARITLNRSKLGLFTTASNELVRSSQFERELIPALSNAVSYERDRAFLVGTGVGQPQGVINAASTISVSKETGQGAATIVKENLDKMLARLHPALFNEAVWVCNPACLPQLLNLSQTIGTGGQAMPVMNNNGSLTIHTRPVLFSSKLPTLGTVGDIILAAFSQYAVGMTRGIAIDKSEHFKFQNDQTVWRARLLCDGQSRWASAFTPQNGSTLSWCVKLATRA